jgi:histidinol dehydrogenase
VLIGRLYFECSSGPEKEAFVKWISYQEHNFDERVQAMHDYLTPAPEVVQTVRQIIADIRQRGDQALVEITNRYSSVPIDRNSLSLGMKVSAPDLKTKKALLASQKNILRFHKKRLPQSWKGRNGEGAEVGEQYLPLDRVGLYIPGGTAPLVSSALMTITLAKLAGVKEIVVVTPPPVHPVLHYAIKLAGATEIYQCGGAQAIAALAYGTASIKSVNKVFGPGNTYVVEAKRQVFGRVGVDLLPGPSEIAVLADKTAVPSYVASDLLAQAEHGHGSRIFLISPDKPWMEKVSAEIEKQIQPLQRQQHLRETLNLSCSFIQVKNLKQGVELVQKIAPEHLSLCCVGGAKLAPGIRNCGAIFVGDFSPVAAGDYAAGPSHELPTNGAGRYSSGLTVDQFVRRTSIVRYDKNALKRVAPTITALAAVEGMSAHQHSIEIRLKKK